MYSLTPCGFPYFTEGIYGAASGAAVKESGDVADRLGDSLHGRDGS